MPDKELSLESCILKPTETDNDLKLISKLEESQIEFWFFTPDVDIKYDSLEKPAIENDKELKRKKSRFKEWFYSIGLGMIMATAGITATHFTLEYAKNKLKNSIVQPIQITAPIKIPDRNLSMEIREDIKDKIADIAFFSLDLLVALLIGILQAGYSLRLTNNQYDMIYNDKRKYSLTISVRIKDKVEYEGENYRAILVSEKIVDESKKEKKTVLKLIDYIKNGMNILPYMPEFPYIIKKKTKDTIYYYIGVIEANDEGRLNSILLSNKKGMPNEIGKSKAYRRKYEAINEISEKLRIKYGNLRK